MAINVNKVYKTALSILNKEQRGYLTPYEFNNIARQVQLELLDKLFYDYNKFVNIENVNRINEGFADLPSKIQEQIDEFYATHTLSELNGNLFALPSNVYQILDLTSGNTKVEKIDKNRLPYLNSSPLTQPSSSFPVYYQTDNSLVVNPQTITNLLLQYIKMPDDPRFGEILKNSTIRIGSIKNSTWETEAKANFPNATFVGYKNWPAAKKALFQKDSVIDAIYRDTTEIKPIVYLQPDLSLEYVPILFDELIDRKSIYLSQDGRLGLKDFIDMTLRREWGGIKTDTNILDEFQSFYLPS